jgi:hypothetical protein
MSCSTSTDVRDFNSVVFPVCLEIKRLAPIQIDISRLVMLSRTLQTISGVLARSFGVGL